MIGIKLWGFFCFVLGRVENYKPVFIILITIKPSVSSPFLLCCFSHFYFHWYVNSLPSDELDKIGRLIYLRECKSTLLGKPLRADFKAKQLTWVEPNCRHPEAIFSKLKQGFEHSQKPGHLNIYWLKSLGFVSDSLEGKCTLNTRVPLARLPRRKSAPSPVKEGSKNSTYFSWVISRLKYEDEMLRIPKANR